VNGQRWFKGNTHTHTLHSDGDSTPAEVVAWYRDHGYDFLMLTDHNATTCVDAPDAPCGLDEPFLVINSEEITDGFNNKPIHINALDVPAYVEPQHGANVVDLLQRNIDAVRRVSGVPQVNHPNFHRALTAADLSALENCRLLEIYNGHPDVNNLGGAGMPGMETNWDQILSSGRLMYGIADDDAHIFRGRPRSGAANPGRGWVVVRARYLDTKEIMDALDHGDFYSSSGVELTEYEVTGTGLTVAADTQASRSYDIQFIGANGRILKHVRASAASYAFGESDQYVRAKIVDSTGKAAWTQPVFPHRSKGR